MLKCILSVALFFSIQSIQSQSTADIKSAEQQLDHLISNKNIYRSKREESIKKLKQEIAHEKLGSHAYFDKSYKIYEAYDKFQSDSALTYLLKCKALAQQLSDSLTISIDLDLARIYASLGQYIEAKNILDDISSASLSRKLKGKYYDTFCTFYSHYGQSNNNAAFYQKSELYRDSLLHVLDEQSYEYKLSLAIKTMYGGMASKAKESLLSLLEKNQDDLEKRALLSYYLGVIQKREGNTELQKYYLIQSACADIERANKDVASFQDLALTYYEIGDIDWAFRLMEQAIDDAMYSNSRYRIIEGTSFYPIINAAYQKRINNQNERLRANLYLISLLSIVLIAGLIVIYMQVKNLKRIRQELSASNSQLMALNKQINDSNIDLSEANHIKEAYITQFFDICSTYIEKMDELRKSYLKKANSNQIDSLIKDLKSTSVVEQEIGELYHNFDNIFLNLYPSFVDDFNGLLKTEEKILPKPGELLNTELRIFALIRLGIDDSVKIASFLRYSVRTVYNYRTKVRNKAAVSRAEFEDMVKKIGTLDR